MIKTSHKLFTGCVFWLLNLPAYAGEADIVKVKIDCDNSCSFHVTVHHQDEGWDHYANKWEVLGPGGEIIATRILHHPHVNEQPFTRSLSNVKIPATIGKVTVRAHDSVHGYGGKHISVDIPVKK